MPITVIVIAAALFLPCWSTAQTREQLLYRDARFGVATITVAMANHREALGTGFFIDSVHLVSCRHVFEDGLHAKVKTSDDVDLDVVGVVADDFSADLIEVEVGWRAKKYRLHLAPKPADSGAAVIVVGSPGGYEQTMLTGVVTGFRSLPGGVNLVQTSAPISSGSSGSPVINVAGDVVGVASISNTGMHIGYAVSVEHVSAMRLHAAATLDKWSASAIHRVDWGELPIGTDRPPFFARNSEMRDFFADDMFNRALDRFRQNDLSTAYKWFVTSCDLGPLRAEAWLYAGRCAARYGQSDQAITMLDNAARLDPRSREALTELVSLYNFLHRFDDARAACNRLIAVDPANCPAWYNLGVVEGETGHDSLALAALDRAARCDPRDPMIHYSRGRVMEQELRPSDAEREYRAALTVDPNLTEARFRLGTLLFETNRTHEALVEFERVVRTDSTNPEAWLSYGGALTVEKRYGDAIIPLKRSLALRADELDAWGNLGACYHELGLRDEEFDAWKNVVRVDPKDPYGHFGLGMMYAEFKHDRPAALKEYEMLKKLDAKLGEELFGVIYK